MTFVVLMLYLNVGESSLVLGAVIDELFAPVNHAVFPHFFKGGIDTADDIFI